MPLRRERRATTVIPVAVMEETFKQNGVTTAGDIHGRTSPAKLREIFGADASCTRRSRAIRRMVVPACWSARRW